MNMDNWIPIQTPPSQVSFPRQLSNVIKKTKPYKAPSPDDIHNTVPTQSFKESINSTNPYLAAMLPLKTNFS